MERNRNSMRSSLWLPAGTLRAVVLRQNLHKAGTVSSAAERGMDMWGESNVGDCYAKSRPPTTVRIEVDLVNRKITATWELLQITKEAAFPLEHLSGDDFFDVLSAASLSRLVPLFF
jgi:hypothetical protein